METNQTDVELVDGETVRKFALAAVLAALLGASSYIAIPLPFSPVPITLQVLIVFLAGLYLGPYWGTVSVGLYLTAGALGAPVFAQGAAGAGVLVGETGGYLWGYAIAPIVIGTIVHDGLELRDPAEVFLPVLVGALVAAMVIIYGLGAAWLVWAFELSVPEAVTGGIVPFLPGDLLKLLAAIAIVNSGRLTPS